MYNIMLLLHSYTRWLVIIAMLLALGWAYFGWIRQREWSKWDSRFGAGFTILITIQFIWGVVLFFLPDGLAQAAWRDIDASMGVRELRFFGIEHGFQMIIALAIVHLGWTRSRKATQIRSKFRWAVSTYTIAAILIASAIPWWRPLMRPIVESPALELVFAEPTPESVSAEPALEMGDAGEGEVLFSQNISGQPAYSTCHTLDEARLVGPGLAGVATRAETRIVGLSAEDYLYLSIVDPGSHIVTGYGDVMPAAYGSSLNEEQVGHLVAYLMTLR